MTNFIKIAIAILMLSTAGFSMKYTVDIDKITDNCLAGLTHKNAGVVESAIKNTIFLKINFPQYNYVKLVEKLDYLAVEGTTDTIRFKAMIASNYLKHFEDFSWIQKGEYEKEDEIFTLYLKQVQKIVTTKNF
jgi:hypothetical protein